MRYTIKSYFVIRKKDRSKILRDCKIGINYFKK